MRNGHVAILAILILVASPITARAKTMVSSFKIKGETVTALFTQSNPDDPCVLFFVSVVASDQVEKTSPPKSKVAEPLVSLAATAEDICVGETLFLGAGVALPQILQIDHNLRSATLKATVPALDALSGVLFDFDIDLTWTATGPAVRQNTNDTFRDRDLGIFVKTRFNGVVAAAEAAGTVVEGTILGALVNFTPEPTTDAEIQRANNGTLIIEKTMPPMPPPFVPEDVIRTIDGTATTESFNGEQAVAVALDGFENVIAAGHTQNPGTGADLTVAKWDPSRNLLWQRTLNGTSNLDDLATGVAVDSQNNVVVVGTVENAGTGTDITVAKWDTGGNLLWVRTLDGTAHTFDLSFAVAVDGQDNILAAGSLQNTGTSADFTVAKLDPAGNLLWLRSLDGTSHAGDFARAIKVDGQNNVIAAGYLRNAGTGADFTVAKWTAGGTQLWVRSLDGTSHEDDFANAVTVDSQNNVLVVGFITNVSTVEDLAAAKWDGNGNQLWVRTIDGSPGFGLETDEAFAVTVDSLDNVIASGFLGGGGISLFSVVKWDAGGNPQWTGVNTAHNMRSQPALSVAVDSLDNIIAVGHTTAEFLAIKWDAGGTEQWRRTLVGTGGTAQGTDVVINSQDKAIASGFMFNTGTEQDFSVFWLCTNCP